MEVQNHEIITNSGEQQTQSKNCVSRSRQNSCNINNNNNNKLQIKHNQVPHSEYFLHRCLQILEEKGQTKEPKKLTDLWQRLSALRRYLTCLQRKKVKIKNHKN